ncbi:MAG: hypothetical protein ACRDTH_25435, partial [Pseudonocardiaceae bacterium]
DSTPPTTPGLPPDDNYDKITHEARTMAGFYNRQLVHLLRRTSGLPGGTDRSSSGAVDIWGGAIARCPNEPGGGCGAEAAGVGFQPGGHLSAEEVAEQFAGPSQQPVDAVGLPAAHPGPRGPQPPLVGVIDGWTDPDLLCMVRRHYDNELLMRLKGEIHFDAALSRAEVEAAARVYGRPLPHRAYLPCCGTLRHALPLLERGVEQLVAVDLSLPSLMAGIDAERA